MIWRGKIRENVKNENVKSVNVSVWIRCFLGIIGYVHV